MRAHGLSKKTAVVSSPLIEHNSSWMLPAQETNTHLTSLLFSFFGHIHSADLHLPKVTRAWFLKRIKAHSMTALEGHSGHFKSHQSYRAAAWRRPCNNTANSAVSSSKKYVFICLCVGTTLGLWWKVTLCEQRLRFLANAMIHGFRVAVLLFWFLRHDMIGLIGPGRDFKLKDISIVMSLSLHCQSCQKCRRRVVATLPPHRHHIVATSPPHRRHMAATLPPHCRHIAATWPPHGRHIAATWPPHCRHIAATLPPQWPPQLPQDLISANKVRFGPYRTLLAEIRSCGSCGGHCGGNVAAMWRQCGGNVAAMWRQCGGDVAAMWRRCGGDMAAMWWRCGGNVATMRWSCVDKVATT